MSREKFHSPVLIFVLLAMSASAQQAASKAGSNAPPNYCKPCLFYAGDFDPSNSSNGLYDEDSGTQEGEVYVPFRVPQGKHWKLTGLAVNLLGSAAVVPSKVKWEIRHHVASGNDGGLIASGSSSSTYGGQFNCGGIAIYCFTLVTQSLSVVIPNGKYWLSVVPQCKHQNCAGVQYYLADVEDIPPLNRYGRIEPWDDSFFNSTTFGYFYSPTWGPSGVCGGAGCDRFSAAVLGKSLNQ